MISIYRHRGIKQANNTCCEINGRYTISKRAVAMQIPKCDCLEEIATRKPDSFDIKISFDDIISPMEYKYYKDLLKQPSQIGNIELIRKNTNFILSDILYAANLNYLAYQWRLLSVTCGTSSITKGVRDTQELKPIG